MNKWIYSSVSLNLFAFWGLFYTLVFLAVMHTDPQEYGDVIGFLWVKMNIICLFLLFCGYLLEVLIYRFCSQRSFSFPYKKIKSLLLRIIYYILFYIGLFIGCGFLVLCTIFMY